MSAMRILAATGLLAAMVVGQDLAAVRSEIRSEIVPAAEKLATWCRRAGLMGECHRVHEAILLWDEDHVRSRQTLGYRRQRDRSWKRTGRRYRRPPNRKPKAIAELRKRETDFFESLAQRALSAARRSGEQDPTRRGLLEAIVALHPACAPAQKALGRVQYEGAWIDRVDQREVSRRKEYRGTVEWALSRAQSREAAELTPEERGSGVKLHAVKAPGFTVVATTTFDEAATVAHHCRAARSVLRKMLEIETPPPTGCRVYVIEKPEHAKALAGALRQAKWDPSAAKGGLIEWKAQFLFVWAHTADRRKAAAAHFFAERLLQLDMRLDYRTGWAHNGLSGHVAREVTGWCYAHGKLENGSFDPFVKKLEADPDWRAQAKSELQKRRLPKVEQFTAKTTLAMSGRDLLAAVTFAEWVLLRAEKPRELYRLAGGNPAEAFETGLGIDMKTANRRYTDWLMVYTRPRKPRR